MKSMACWSVKNKSFSLVRLAFLRPAFLIDIVGMNAATYPIKLLKNGWKGKVIEKNPASCLARPA